MNVGENREKHKSSESHESRESQRLREAHANAEKRSLKNMDDFELESLFESAVSTLPPEDIVAVVTPWKKPMNRVLVGTALTTFTLNFLCLEYILPAIGLILLLLGLRALRRENKWFKACFALAIIRAAYFFPLLIANTTILESIAFGSGLSVALGGIGSALNLVAFVCLWRGFISTRQKAGLSPHAGAAVALIVWYAALLALSLIRINGTIAALLMVAVYILIVRGLWKLSGELNEAGYAIKTAPFKLNDRCVVAIIASLLLCGCVCGYLFGGSYPMEWTELDTTEHSQVEKAKGTLIDLGFPKNVLDDLSAQDIAACANATCVVVDTTDAPVNGGRIETSKRNGEVYQKTVYDVKELRLTGVGVKVSGENEHWIIIHHFLWTTNPGFYGTESLQLWPTNRNEPDYLFTDNGVTGRILFDDGGKTFVADYYSLGAQTYTSADSLLGSERNTDTFATFSMPRSGSNHRGYLMYSVDGSYDDKIVDSWVNYTHQRSWLQYPVVTAIEKRKSNGWSEAGAFKTVQDALQFWPADNGAQLFE